MRRIMWLALVFAVLVPSLVSADDSAELKKRISALTAFEAQFSQKVTRADTTEISASRGIISIARPDRLMMHTLEPDEQVLFTREGDVYFYDPFVNQVTIFPQSRLQQSPFWLLSARGDALWQDYQVSRKGEVFTLTPKHPKEFTGLTLTYSGTVLQRISLKMRDGSDNTYDLSGQRSENTHGIFDYAVPADAEIDDER